MTQFFKAMPRAIGQFVRDEDGAQIIEYALIIAVVSLALIGSMELLADTDFDAWITRVGGLLNPA